jgi:hypothetical protein
VTNPRPVRTGGCPTGVGGIPPARPHAVIRNGSGCWRARAAGGVPPQLVLPHRPRPQRNPSAVARPGRVGRVPVKHVRGQRLEPVPCKSRQFRSSFQARRIGRAPEARGCGLHKGARDEGSLIVGETIFREMDGRPPSGGASAPLALGA